MKTRTHSSNKGKRFPVEVLTQGEVTELIETCSRRAPTGIRNRAMLTLLYRSGLRISECLALRPKDLDPLKCSVRVLHGKGDKARTVGMDRAAFAIVERWLDVRKRRGINGHSTAFCTLKGSPLHTAYVRELLPRLAKRAGIDKRVHPHGLRHTHAAELAAEGVPINVIQKQLGHANLAITSHYLDHISAADVVAVVRGREWAGVN